MCVSTVTVKKIKIFYTSTFPYFPGLLAFYFFFGGGRVSLFINHAINTSILQGNSKIYEVADLAVQKLICLRANVETGVSLIPLSLYLFSSPLWNIPLALWSMYKEELFKSQLEEGQFKASHQHGWFPTNHQLIFHVCISILQWQILILLGFCLF